jgi:hypothetical protein
MRYRKSDDFTKMPENASIFLKYAEIMALKLKISLKIIPIYKIPGKYQ